MTTPALKPCPFCGGSAKYLRAPTDALDLHYVACSTCGTEQYYQDTEQEAAAAWNRRTT